MMNFDNRVGFGSKSSLDYEYYRINLQLTCVLTHTTKCALYKTKKKI